MSEIEKKKLEEITALAAELDANGKDIISSYIDGFVAGKAAGERKAAEKEESVNA